MTSYRPIPPTHRIRTEWQIAISDPDVPETMATDDRMVINERIQQQAAETSQ